MSSWPIGYEKLENGELRAYVMMSGRVSEEALTKATDVEKRFLATQLYITAVQTFLNKLRDVIAGEEVTFEERAPGTKWAPMVPNKMFEDEE